jgi:O-antigen/teichoic acid export membrane protein
MNKLLSSILKTGGSSLASVFFLGITSKVIALNYGAPGIGAFSLIKQLVVSLSFFGAGMQTAVVRGMAAVPDGRRSDFFWSAFLVSCLGSSLTIFGLLVYNLWASNSVQAMSAVSGLGASVLLIATVTTANLYFLLKSVLNGVGLIGLLAAVEVVGPLSMALLAVALVVVDINDISMAALGMFLFSQVIMASGAIYLLHKNCSNWLTKPVRRYFFSRCKDLVQEIINVSLLTTAATLISGGALLLLRSLISEGKGLDSAGLFDATWTISGSYVMLLLGSFNTYYMPALAAESDLRRRNDIINDVLKVSIYGATLLIGALVILKPIVIEFLYSEQFYPSLDLLRWTLIGDYIKITAWVFAVPAIARGYMGLYLKTEAIWWILFASLSWALLKLGFGIEVVAVVYVLLYMPLAIFYYVWLGYSQDISISMKSLFLWFGGAGGIIGLSAVCWSERSVSYEILFLWLLGGTLLFYAAASSLERQKCRQKLYALYMKINGR